jgi:hypothetical protein
MVQIARPYPSAIHSFHAFPIPRDEPHDPLDDEFRPPPHLRNHSVARFGPEGRMHGRRERLKQDEELKRSRQRRDRSRPVDTTKAA